MPAGATGFRQLGARPGRALRGARGRLGSAKAGRAERRTSLAYFGQLSDFQLADEESPARVEFVDPVGPPVDAAWRPWEALEPQIDDAMIRQINPFAAAQPGRRTATATARPMDFTIDTGDSADSQQLNETHWVRTLLEGGALDPNSGVDPSQLHRTRSARRGVPGAAEAARYTGVQDYDDYFEGPNPYFYDPDDPRGQFAGWPKYPGLMDRRSSLHRRRPRRPQLRRLRQPRRPRAGQPGREPGLRAGRAPAASSRSTAKATTSPARCSATRPGEPRRRCSHPTRRR